MIYAEAAVILLMVLILGGCVAIDAFWLVRGAYRRLTGYAPPEMLPPLPEARLLLPERRHEED